MKKFNVRKGNYIKDSNNTKKIMNNVIISLIPIVIFAFYKNGILPIIKEHKFTLDMCKIILLLIIPIFVCLFTEYFYYIIIKKDKKSLKILINEYFAIIPGIFIGLVIPINTPLWLVALAAFLASLSKMILGGFGKNKLNPALVGASIIIIFASSYIGIRGGYLNSYEIDAVSSATPLSNLSALSYIADYDKVVGPYGNLWNFFFGNVPGAIGETSAFLCIAAFLYLIFCKVIKWRISVFYVGTVFVISLFVGLYNGIGLWYPVFCILSGSLLFGAIFMATDPVTSPITKHGQVLGGIFLGVITCFVRYLTSFPEGVLISILLFNILTIFIDRLSIKFNFNNLYKIISLIILVLLGITLSICVSINLKNNNVSVENDSDFLITNKVVSGNEKIYYITSRGYTGKKSIESKITMINNKIISFEILSSKESYMSLIENGNYLNNLVNNQDNLNNVDVISGATYTSKYLKELVTKIKEYDMKN